MKEQISLFVLFFIQTFPRAFHSFHLSLLSRNVVDRMDNTESKAPRRLSSAEFQPWSPGITHIKYHFYFQENKELLKAETPGH